MFEQHGFDALSRSQVNAVASAITVGYYPFSSAPPLHFGDENRQLNVVRSGTIELRNVGGDLVTRTAEISEEAVNKICPTSLFFLPDRRTLCSILQ